MLVLLGAGLDPVEDGGDVLIIGLGAEMHPERHTVVTHAAAEDALFGGLAWREDGTHRRLGRAGLDALAGREVQTAIALGGIAGGMADDAGGALAEGVRGAHQGGDVVVGDGDVPAENQHVHGGVVAFKADAALAQILDPLSRGRGRGPVMFVMVLVIMIFGQQAWAGKSGPRGQQQQGQGTPEAGGRQGGAGFHLVVHES
jgi:hypothetical protein